MGPSADILNREDFHYRNRSGAPRAFRLNDVRRAITHWRVYSGHLTKGRTQGAPPETIIENAWPAILPLDLIERAKAVQATRQPGHDSHAEIIHTYELTPLLACAHCGQSLEGHVARGRRAYRHSHKGECSGERGSLDASTIEDKAATLIRSLIVPPEDRPMLEEAARHALAVKHAENSAEIAHLNDLKDKREREISLFRSGYSSWHDFQTKVKDLDEQINTIEVMLGETLASTEQVVTILEHMSELELVIREAGPRSRKRLFAQFFQYLEVDIDTRQLYFHPHEWTAPFFQIIADVLANLCRQNAPGECLAQVKRQRFVSTLTRLQWIA